MTTEASNLKQPVDEAPEAQSSTVLAQTPSQSPSPIQGVKPSPTTPRLLRRVAPPVPLLVEARQFSPAMDDAANFLAGYMARAAKGEKRVVLFGDFDVDGTSSAAIMFLFSKLCAVRDVVPYVSRRKDGYGLTKGAIHRLVSETPDPSSAIVIMMDLGVSSTAECEELLRRGYTTMVIDHHVPGRKAKKEWEVLKKKYGTDKVYVYDPLLCEAEDDREFKVLSAAGLVYKLCMRILDQDFSGLGKKVLSQEKAEIQASGRPQSVDAVLATMAKICSIAQAADCMPFAQDGKVTAAWHLAKEFERPSALLAGIRVLYEKTNTASRIGWVIGPILNAAGRLEDAYAAFELMVETDEEEARAKLLKMEEIRKKVQLMTKSASVTLDDSIITSRGVAALIADPAQIKGGVVGIAAARAADHFKAPAVYFSPEQSEEHGLIFKGSMRRGPTTFSCEEWVLSLRERGIAFAGGGHPAAAGIAVKEDQLEALVASAEEQPYELDLPPHYEVTVEAALDYTNKITEMMPFGRGHESAILSIKGMLTGVRPLTTDRSGEKVIWTYILTIADFESSMPIEVKAMASELDEKMTNLLGQIQGKSLTEAVEIRAVVHDNYRATSRYARGELRAYASAEGVMPDETESGRRAQLRFLSKAEFEEFQASEKKAAAENSRADAEAARKTQKERDNLGLDSDGLLPDDDINFTNAAEDLNGDTSSTHEAIIAAAGQAAVTVHVDWNDSIHRRVFMLRRPSKVLLEETLGLEGLERISALHGGRWNDRLKCYLISSGVIEKLLSNYSDKWKFVFSAKALQHWEELKKEFDEVDVKKADSSPFDIPFFKAGGRIKPLGFQYADVRLYLERKVSLCNNAMGTGKSFESGMLAALLYKGAELDEKRQPVIPAGAKERRVLFVTLKSVMEQFANELEEIFDVKVARVSTQSIREVLVNLGEVTKGKAKSSEVETEDRAGEEVDAAGAAGDGKLKPIFKISAKAKAAFDSMELAGKHYVITTYECLARNPWLVSSYEWGGVMIDEAHEIKGKDAHKTKALLGPEIDGAPLRHGDYTAPILAMSGTFTKNRPSDWFPWIRLTGADGGIYTDGKVAQCKVRFDMRFDGLRFEKIRVRGGLEKTITVKGQPENGDEVKRMLTPFVVRRLITEIDDMPPFRSELQRVPSNGLYLDVISKLSGAGELSPESLELLNRYNLLGKGGEILSEGVSAKEGDGDDFVSEMKEVDPSSLAGKLAMVSSLDKASGVLNALEERGWLSPNERGEIEPFVIMTFHQCAGKEVARQLELAGISHHLMTQNDSSAKREEKKTSFQRGEKIAFVSSLGVGGTGLNLVKASRMMIVNLPWTETALAQGIARIFRLGQKNPVEVAILLLLSSVDEGVYHLLKNKGAANSKTLGVDKMRQGEIPTWATGHVMENAVVVNKGKGAGSYGKNRWVKGAKPTPEKAPEEAPAKPKPKGFRR